MSGLIRGKRLVWVFDGPNYCESVSQFGEYECFPYDGGFHWSISTLDTSNMGVINEGQETNIAIAQSACQADHDSRVMASVEVPIEWEGDKATCGSMRLNVWQVPESDEWQWDARYLVNPPFTYGIEDARDDAVKAAETFVRQLVLGVQK